MKEGLTIPQLVFLFFLIIFLGYLIYAVNFFFPLSDEQAGRHYCYYRYPNYAYEKEFTTYEGYNNATKQITCCLETIYGKMCTYKYAKKTIKGYVTIPN